MYLYGKAEELGEILSDERFISLGIKPESDMERLIAMLNESGIEEPVVILDSGNGGLRLTLSFIKKLKSGVDVYVLSRRKKDADFVVETFRAGASDIFFYENMNEAEGHFKSIYHGLRKNLSKSIAFVGAGTGGTFLSVNVACALKRLYGTLEICLADCDHYKNDAAMRMGVDDSQKLLTMQDLMADIYEGENFDLGSFLLKNRISGISLIPAADWSFYTSEFSNEEYIKVLACISMQNDMTVLNLGQWMDETFRSILAFSDMVYLVTTQEMVPLRVSVNLLNLLKRLGKEGVTEIVINRFKKEKGLPPLNTMESILGKKINFTVPNDYKTVSVSEFEMRAFEAGDNHSLAAGIESIARNIIRTFVR